MGDPFTVELSRLLLNALGAASALISGQRAILRDVWPKVGRDPSEFEQGPYTEKRLELFVEIEAKLIVDLRNYAQHKFLPKLDATTYWSTQIPLGELRFMLSTKPLLEWDRLSAPVREYLKAAGDSVDLLPIYQRYTVSVREFFKWFWLQVEDAMRAERAEIKAHGEELNAFAEDVFLAPDWFQNGGEPPANWATIAPRWRRTRKAKIRLKRAEIGHTQSGHRGRQRRQRDSRRAPLDTDNDTRPLIAATPILVSHRFDTVAVCAGSRSRPRTSRR